MAPSTQFAPPSFLLPTECARVFHTGGARLVLCGKNWERLENLYDALISVADPSKVRPRQSAWTAPGPRNLRGLLKSSSLVKWGEMW